MAFLDRFQEIWAVDFEFRAPDGERPHVVCMVAIEYRTGRRIRMWEGEFGDEPPFRTDGGALFLVFFASAELGCFRSLGWADPENVLDLWIEHARAKNNRPLPPEHRGKSLVSALQSFGLSHLDASEKVDLRRLIMENEIYTGEQRAAILDYCESDVVALVRLLPAMEWHIDGDRALIRGAYMAAVAEMEFRGVPIDEQMFDLVRDHRDRVRRELIERVDPAYGVFDDGSFKTRLFGAYLLHAGLLDVWPRTDTGTLSTRSQVMRDMATVYPELGDLKEVLATDRVMKNNQLAVGNDGRNRCLLSPFASKTGRNQPSNSKFIFGPACWMRGLIKPRPGWAVSYVDWSQQEIGIAAALSGDANLITSYQSGDPYLQFAKLAQAVPPALTKQALKGQPETSPDNQTRAIFKQCMLAVNYGMGSYSLARDIRGSQQFAQHLLHLHRGLYRQFWKWSDAAVDHVLLERHIDTVFGWRLHLDNEPNTRSLANFACQANGAEMMRIAAILMKERGIPACCPVHDAFLVEGPIGEIDQVVESAQQAMSDASAAVLDGFRLATDAETIHAPGRFMDEKRGRRIWDLVVDVIDKLTGPKCQEKTESCLG